MRVVTQWWETKKVKVCGERFWRVGMDERVCMKRLLSREEVLLLRVVEDGASEMEEYMIESSHACCFCLGSEIVE